MPQLNVGIIHVYYSIPFHALRVIYSYVTQTVVVTQNQVTCRLEEYFPCPDKFLPERWMKGSTEYRVCSPYLVLPFGHGPRSCIARRLAEQALQVLIIRVRTSFLLKNYLSFLFIFVFIYSTQGERPSSLRNNGQCNNKTNLDIKNKN